MRRSLFVLGLAAVMVMAMGVGTAFAGEITGNGKPLWTGDNPQPTDEHHTLHGKSLCAFSGQEDGQFFVEQGPDAGDPVDPVVKGSPAHAQSWGQIPKALRDNPPPELAELIVHPGIACNPTRAGAHPE